MDRPYYCMNGLVIGRFIPPHSGHNYLIEYALHSCDQLYIMLCALRTDAIPGNLRLEWMQQLYPKANIVYVEEENPKAERHNPGAPEIWAKAVKKYIGKNIGAVFASEEYGSALAKWLQAKWIPVDISRGMVPVSGYDVRTRPAEVWEFIPAIVQYYFVQNIVLQLNEAPRLVRKLATYYDTSHCTTSKQEIEMARNHANRFIFIDASKGKLSRKDCRLLVSKEAPTSAKSVPLLHVESSCTDIDFLFSIIVEKITEVFHYSVENIRGEYGDDPGEIELLP